MDPNMKVPTLKEKSTEPDISHLKTNQTIKANFSTIPSTEKGNSYGPIIRHTMDSGSTVRCTAKELSSGATVDTMREILLREKDMARESIFLLMEESIKVNGKAENKMERETLLIKLERLKKDFSRK